MRYACLYVPDFPLAARLRAEPALDRVPVALLDGPVNSPRICAVTLEASASGVAIGQSAPQARAVFPSVLLRPRDLLAERSASQALRETADAFSPRIEPGGPGVFFLDISPKDAERCIGSSGRPNVTSAEEASLAESLGQRARSCGLPCRVAVADSRAAARAAAESSRGSPVIVAPGGCAAFLAPLGLQRLHAPPELAQRLRRWGIRTAGALAKLEAGEVEARLGLEGLALHRAARGLDERDFVPEPHPARFFEGRSLEWPVAELGPFCELAREVLDRLAARLSSQGCACRKLDVTLELDPEGRDTRELALAAPTREAKTWLGLLRLDLERRPPRAPVIGLCALAHPEEARCVQLTLFGPPAASPDKVSTALARLSAWLGPDRVGVPGTRNDHRPENFSVAGYEVSGGGAVLPLPPTAHIAVRVLRPRVSLTVRPDAGGKPEWLRSSDSTLGPFEGSVRTASGPWRLESGWWTEESARRDYWDVELSDGALYRIFRDIDGGRWFADGIYD